MINVGVIGLGRIGFSLEKDPYREKPCTHVGAILENKKTKLVAGIDINPEKRNFFTSQLKIKSYASLSEALINHPIDILHIATPTPTHLSLLKEAIKAKIKVVVLEKPIAISYQEALKVLPLLKKNTTRVIVNHERRFAEDYVYLKKIILQKKYGELLSINSFLYTNNPNNFQSLLHDGTHLIDILDFLIPPQNNKKKIGHFEALKKSSDDSMRFFFEMRGIPIYWELGGKKKFFHFENILYFEKGRVEIGNGFFREHQSKSSRLYKGFQSLQEIDKQFSKTYYFRNMVKHAVALYQNKNLESQSSFKDGLAILEFIDKLAKSNINKK